MQETLGVALAHDRRRRSLEGTRTNSARRRKWGRRKEILAGNRDREGEVGRESGRGIWQGEDEDDRGKVRGMEGRRLKFGWESRGQLG